MVALADWHLILYPFVLFVAPAYVLGLREANLFVTDTHDLLSNVSAEVFEAEPVAPLIPRSTRGESVQCGAGFGYCAKLTFFFLGAYCCLQISEVAVRPVLSVVNMDSACDLVTHAVRTSLARRMRCAVMEDAIRKEANAVTTVATVVRGTTVERAGGR
ncbi:hypothetical protein BDV38DRAFT_280182 [Aspergillus pseudotamarii]|uniref:Uncharacterized protein n=1 Tax=Aspergillus pseudotamarii TaxID=132259 RepID=A0A5N6SZW8_ASPPS|nr:uncharacterized protein BDV38DRAFT_280182 [Aspergillus pseudotamarii]KAE8140185.1 hypothetical protein BDV38DRAFT_280182 [Aspergillus pseudotamarii]